MRPEKFAAVNIDYFSPTGADQRLPAHLDNATGVATFCWKLTKEELAEIEKTGVIWHQVKTHGHPLQPQKLSTTAPELT